MIGGVTQAVQHTWMVGARVLAENEDRVGMVEIVKTDGAFADADAALQTGAARFVAHIGAVREVIGARQAAEQLIEPGGFVAGAARSVELHLVRVVHRLDMLRDERKGVVPAYRLIVIGFGVITHRVSQAALILQEVVALRIKFGDAVLGKKIGVNHATRCFPGHRFGAVFTETKGAFVIVAPGAARAVEAARFVHAHQVAHIFQRSFAV